MARDEDGRTWTRPARTRRGQAMRGTPRVLPFLLSLSSGAALIVALIARQSLGLVLFVLVLLAAVVSALVWAMAAPRARVVMVRLATAGLLAGAIATASYDAWRWGLVRVTGWTFNPFHTFVVFGYLLGGRDLSEPAAATLGALYHWWNGEAFAVAFCFLSRGADWKWGIAWALCLEAAMLTIYPSGLTLDAITKEFTVVSLSGHLVYGAVLGLVAQRRLANLDET